MKIFNKTQATVVADYAELADNPASRLVGLLNRPSLAERSALVITDCRSIHMLFMRFAIDVIFTDRNDRVVGLVRNIRPFRLSPYFWRAYYAIELPVGTIARTRTMPGDQIKLE